MVNMENYEEYMLLEADGELNETERKALYTFLEQHPELKKEMDAYMSTRLIPDEQLVYEHKEELLKKSGGGRVIGFNRMFAYGAAAALLILLTIFIINKQPENTQVAKTQPEIKKEAPAVVQAPAPTAPA